MTPVPFCTAAEIAAAVPIVAPHVARDLVVGYPTETVYGLGGRATDAAVSALARRKARGDDKPFLLLVAGRRMAEAMGVAFTAAGAALAEACWPGPLTLVLPCVNAALPARLRGPGGGVAVRWTSHAGMATLIAALGAPLTSTSANAAGQEPVTSAADLAAAFPNGGSLLVLDGGTLPPSTPSTVVDCCGERARVVREGAISLAELRRRAGRWAP